MAKKIVLVDDHALLRDGLAGVLEGWGHVILFQADDGQDFINKLDKDNLPDLVLLDISMKNMDGHETAKWLKEHHPEIMILALSMLDNEEEIFKMLKNGAKGYILKDAEPAELKAAIESVFSKGYYYSELVTGRLIHTINNLDEEDGSSKKATLLNEREIEFLKLVVTEMTYKEIADQMHLSPRTIDGYRDALFEKLDIKSRVGLAMYAIKHGIVKV